MSRRFASVSALARRACSVALLAAAACAPAIPANAPPPPADPARYESERMWVCRGDLPSDACRRDLDVTVLAPDGSRTVVPFVPASAPPVDCFYVYPTVDMGIVADNHVDFADTSRMREVARAQVAHFGSVCRIFAPLYRQASIGSYLRSADAREQRLAFAFSDVLAAFRWYLSHVDSARRIVLIGHSQGADMIARLVRAVFDDDPAMRARLVVAMPIGWPLDVPTGTAVGGAFSNVPLCTSDDETGCVVTFRSYRAQTASTSWIISPPSGHEWACVNPTDIAGNTRRWLSAPLFPTHAHFVDVDNAVTTPFVVVPSFYSARCVTGTDGLRYLSIAAAPADGDRRSSPVHLDAFAWGSQLGLHLLDLQLAQGDLVDLVRRKSARAGVAATPSR